MYCKYFFKYKGVLPRRFVASGLAVAFSAGVLGSYAGGMENVKQVVRPELVGAKEIPIMKKAKLNLWAVETRMNPLKIDDFGTLADGVFDHVSKMEETEFGSKDLFSDKFFESFSEKEVEVFKSSFIDDKDLMKRLYSFLVMYFFGYAIVHSNSYGLTGDSVSDILKYDLDISFEEIFTGFRGIFSAIRLNILKQIVNGWGKDKIPDVIKKDEIIKKGKKNAVVIEKEVDKSSSEIGNSMIKEHGNLIVEKDIKDILGEQKNIIKLVKSKNSERSQAKVIFLIAIVIAIALLVIGIIIFVAIKPAGKSKTNTGVPNNNKDDEKVNPSIEPEKDKDDEKMNPSTDPESDDQNPEQKKQEQESSVRSVETANLKAVGASVFLGGGLAAGYGTYLVNEVLLKRGKSSEVKNQKNVNGKHMSLDSAGNKVTKTEEGKEIHNSDGTKNKDIGVSDAKQYLEDKDAEKTEEEQEEILERSALSDDTEVTSDEDKNKD